MEAEKHNLLFEGTPNFFLSLFHFFSRQLLMIHDDDFFLIRDKTTLGLPKIFFQLQRCLSLRINIIPPFTFH